MAVVARGTVQDRPWGRTMSFVSDRRFSGELIVDADSRRYVVSFDDGAVVAAISPLATDAAVRVALTAGLVMSSQVAEIGRQVAARADLDEVEAVATALKLAPDQVDRLRRRVIAHKAIRGFALERGEFVLTDERHLAFSPSHAIDVRALIYLGARTHMSEQRLLQELARLGPGFQLRGDALATLPQFGFSDAEKPILAALRAAPVATIDLDAAAPELDPRTARAVVYSLAVTNSLEISTTSVGMDRAHASSKAPPIGGDRTRRTGPSAAITGAGGLRPGMERSRKTPTPFPAQEQSDVTARALRSSTDPGAARAKRISTDPPSVRGRRASTDPGTASRATRPPSDPGTARSRGAGEDRRRREAAGGGRLTKASIPLPGADDDSASYRTKTASSPGTVRAHPASQPVIDSKDHRRPAKRSSMHAVNLPIAAEVRALIKERAAQLDAGVDHFVLLGVHPDAMGEDIRRGYFSLARRLHPDRLTALGIVDEDRAAQRLFAQINAAFAVVSSPTKRQEYRKTLAAGGEKVVRQQQDRAEALARKLLGAEEKFQIGAMALRRDQLDVALAHFKEAVALNPDEADHHAMLGWTIFAMASDKATVFKEARGHLDKAIRMAPKAVLARLQLGRVARMMNRDKEAIDQFQEVLRLSPGHTEARSELRVLQQRQRSDTKNPSDKGGLFGRFKK